jgi:hypothetical protein
MALSHRYSKCSFFTGCALLLAIGCSEGTRKAPHSHARTPADAGPAGTKTEATGVGGQATTAGNTSSGVVAAGAAGVAGGCSSTFLDQSFAGASASTCDPNTLPTSFAWETSGPIIGPFSDDGHKLVSVKDPTAVFFNGLWHVYATYATTGGAWNMVYLNFSDWSAASTAPQYYMDKTPGLLGYHCAPQLFYFTPQNKWYLVYQSGPPQFSTADDPARPETWTAPKSFYASEPAVLKANGAAGMWLDFWVICDDKNCYLFFSDDNGSFYRARTAIADFPNGFGEPEIVIKDTKENCFEASNVYKVKGTNKYLLLIEAFGPSGQRYFRSWTTENLDGTWTPLAGTWANPFASYVNMAPAMCTSKWTEDISHGELLRDGYDEKMTVDPCHLRLLYQGVAVGSRNNSNYSQIPWRLGLAAPRP